MLNQCTEGIFSHLHTHEVTYFDIITVIIFSLLLGHLTAAQYYCMPLSNENISLLKFPVQSLFIVGFLSSTWNILQSSPSRDC